ncbi:MAG: tRNA lysidine(34) synthetase TilS [Bacteroidales bacterium]|nr:tRNA lysidine(34) synthetase TilS [Bacteroidales bacterium]
MSLISQHILQRVSDFIAKNQLLPLPSKQGDREGMLYVALSGGPDSVALLHILHRLGYDCEALHCNFHLRGTESERDQQFCEQLCAILHVPLLVQGFDTYTYMQEHHLSVEMAARELRYNWWRSLTLSEGLRMVKNGSKSSKGCLNPSEPLRTPQNLSNPSNCPPPKHGDRGGLLIALGHHQDDSIETMLMNMMRGTGINGMTGIVVKNESTHVIRPLLCLSRQDIIDYLRDNDLSYVIDSTNDMSDTLRNQIRNQLLILMEQMVPQVRQGILQTMEHLQGTAWFAERYLGLYDALTMHHEKWGFKWQELNLDEAARQFPEHLDDFLHEWKARYFIPSKNQIIRTAKLLYTAPVCEEELDKYQPSLSFEEKALDGPLKGIPQPSSPYENTFDADTLTLPLHVRRWREGDRIAPLGMKGHTRLVSDLFTDAHYSPMQKATTWLLCDAKGVILWVIGLRMSDAHKVSSTTRNLIRVSCK